MRAARLPFFLPPALILGVLMPLVELAGAPRAAPAQPADPSVPTVQHLGTASLEQALLLGPLPVPPPPAEPVLPGAEVELVPEVDPGRWPAPGEQIGVSPGLALSWREVGAADGIFELPGPGVWWLAARLQVARWTRVKLEAPAGSGAQLYLDGEKIEPAEAGEDEAGTAASRGTHVVMARLEIEGAGGSFSLHVATDPPSRHAWVLERPVAPAEFVRSAQIATLGPLAVAPGGELVARRLARAETEEGRPASVEVLDGRGRLVASELAGPQARPVSFSPDGKLLLLSRPARGGEGTDLLLWQAPQGPARTVLEAEPGLGLVRWSPDGRFLLLGSSRGTEADEPDEDEPRRVTALRRRVPDYEPLRHLHLLDLESGFRRRLTSPGDYVLDDAVFLPADERGRAGGARERTAAAPAAILYGRTVPRPERPWFATEFRLLDPASGQERLLAEFSGGWEVRPQGFAAAPDGRAVAFIGPPDEIGDGRTERNVYNKQVWLLDLDGAGFRRLSAGDVAYESGDLMGSGLPGWRGDGKALVVPVQDRARRRLGLLQDPGRGARADRAWDLQLLGTAGEDAGGAALAPGGGAVAFVASAPAALPALGLVQTKADARPRLLEEPNGDLARSWRLSVPRDASYAGPDGEVIEAWWFPPLARVDEADAGMPLVVSYYGGSSPTGRGFNFTHQWFAANGYAVLVVNPRGAAGYGEDFADVHVADWGEMAAGDILSVLDHFLVENPQVDGERIGIYGGSYGGFVTEYLVSETERFGAAVSLYGISSLPSYWGQGGWGWTYGDMAVGGATPWADPELFWQRSPLFRAARITTPLLLLHGTADVNVPPGESEQLFTALAIQDRPVELVLFPGEGHGLSGERVHRLAHREMILEWFDRWLRGQPEAWEERWK